MSHLRWQRLGFAGVLLVLIATGIVSAVYVLVHERLPLPFRDTYQLNVELSAADGVAPGLGQPVDVAGVGVGTITAARIVNGNALVTLTIDRNQLPRVYADANATLAPITPLGDMEVLLDPGHPPSRPLPGGATIGIGQTSSPIPLSDLLSQLDTDTRSFLTTLIASLGEGTQGRGLDLRRALLALGPTADQAREITVALQHRDASIARLVHNIALVTRAASQDQQLASLVTAGNQTLDALSSQDAPLRLALTKLPGTLQTIGSTLVRTKELADQSAPTLTSLTPAFARLPATLSALQPFSEQASAALARQIRPLVREAQPLLGNLGPAARELSGLSPNLATVMQVANYALNETAYHPPGNDEGFLFWLDWWFHNYDSFSEQDANGGAARAMVMVNCEQLTGLAGLGEILKLALGVYDLCPG
ncbi:MlaD family protein [Conexibacter sp. DBS9H8]|uniref:MlaD family protein n=1 Tax=Conexibacter sp. DBS9H8 TaxID=2937801 RepID=UPI00200BCD71|nr:MlaD family protein [Conexibacter sp. DBS9H8]